MMTRKLEWSLACSAVIVALAVGSFGCSSGPKGPERSAKAVDSLNSTKDEVAKADAQVGETLKSLDALVRPDQVDLRGAYAQYVDEVRETRKMAEAAAKRAAAMRDRTDAYVTQWQAEQGTITDPELQRSSQERAATAKAEFQRVRSLAQDARAAYDPWMQSLTDIQTYLANDLTPTGAAAARSKSQWAMEQGNSLRKRLAELQAELDRVAARWSGKAGG